MVIEQWRRGPLIPESGIEIRESEYSDPFVVRSHHFFHFGALLVLQTHYGTRAPQEFAKRIYQANSSLSESVKVDTIGTCVLDHLLYKFSLRSRAAEFLGSPDNRQVRLVEGQKDEICHCTRIGKHCDTRDLREFKSTQSSDILRDEKDHMNSFFDFVDASSESNLYRLSFEEVVFSDGPSSYGRVVTTDMGVFRRFLRSGMVKGFDAEKLRESLHN